MTTRRGRPPINRIAAAAWLATQPDLLQLATADITYISVGTGRPQDYKNWEWRRIAEGLQDAGFFSVSTSVMRIPVQEIVTRALVIRAAAKSREEDACGISSPSI